MSIQNEVSTLIRAIRRQTGLTQEKMAARLGVTFPTINRWEHGRARPSPLAILRLKELVDSLSRNGMDLSDRLESSHLSAKDRRRLPRYGKEVIYIDAWPVLEQGTD